MTELLADLLERLPHSEQLQFCEDFLFAKHNGPDKDGWIKRAKKSDKFTWKTQVRVLVSGAEYPKRPDIVLYDDDGPLLVIECKIGAKFTEGSLTEERDGVAVGATMDQLGFYDKWLHAQPGRELAIVLLTHLVEPPKEFLDPSGTYKVALRSVCRWPQLYEWLTKKFGIRRWVDKDKVLIEGLVAFLKENDLMSESPTLSDFAAARLYLCGGPNSRIEETMRGARQAIKSRFSNLKLTFPNNAPKLSSGLDAGWVYDWCRIGEGPYISWGFFFIREGSDEFADQYDPPWTVFEGAYVAAEFAETVKRPAKNGFEQWLYPIWKVEKGETFEVFCAVPLSHLVDDIATGFVKWVLEHFDDARKLIAVVAGK